MDSQQAFRRSAYRLTGLDLDPGLHDCVQRMTCDTPIVRCQVAISYPSHERGSTLGTGAPPYDKGRVLVQNIPYSRGTALLDAERHNGRRIPELHQPSSRSRDTAARTVASASTGRGQSQKSAGKGALGRLSSPFLSISFKCSASDDAPAMGSKRAIGRPRSVINTSSPAFTWRRYALNDVLSLDTVAISIILTCLVKTICLL